MKSIQIKNESNPTRCEICHQYDQFDPNTGICIRCIHFQNKNNKITNKNKLLIDPIYSKTFNRLFWFFCIANTLLLYFYFHIYYLISVLISFVIARYTLTLIIPIKFIKPSFSLDEIKFIPLPIDSISFIEIDELNQITAKIETLGFVKVLDFNTVYYERILKVSRLLYNNTLNCYAEISKVNNELGDSIYLKLSTFLKDGWVISSYNQQITYPMYLYRLPKKLYFTYRNIEINDLLVNHNEKANLISKELGINIITNIDKNQYLDWIRDIYSEYKLKMNNKRYYFILFEKLKFKFRKKESWLGEYTKSI
jgi:hypothetical protein